MEVKIYVLEQKVLITDGLGSKMYLHYIEMKIKHIISIATFVTLIVGMVIYMTIPFSKLEQIHVFREDVTPDDKVGVFIDRFLAYNHYIYVYKGMSFNEIPCYGNDGKKYTFNIKFNWDNSISIYVNDKKNILYIDSVDFKPTLSYGLAYMRGNILAVKPVADDEFFEGISFCDTQQKNDSIPYSITLYRQQKSLPNGPNRYAFELYINNNHLSTGNKKNGHFFEY